MVDWLVVLLDVNFFFCLNGGVGWGGSVGFVVDDFGGGVFCWVDVVVVSVGGGLVYLVGEVGNVGVGVEVVVEYVVDEDVGEVGVS